MTPLSLSTVTASDAAAPLLRCEPLRTPGEPLRDDPSRSPVFPDANTLLAGGRVTLDCGCRMWFDGQRFHTDRADCRMRDAWVGIQAALEAADRILGGKP